MRKIKKLLSMDTVDTNARQTIIKYADNTKIFFHLEWYHLAVNNFYQQQHKL